MGLFCRPLLRTRGTHHAFILLFFGLLAMLHCSLAAEWADAGVRVTQKQMACYADDQLYHIMQTGSNTYTWCLDENNRGNYPTGGKQGVAFCLFDQLNYFQNSDKMKINWDQISSDFGTHSHMVDECKDTDYDSDGGFWDTIGDWFGEDFDYGTVNTAVGNFYNCCAKKVTQEAETLFKANFFAQCPA